MAGAARGSNRKRRSSDLYVLAIERGARLRLTNDPERAEFPQWSPDGRWIAFRKRDRGLFLISPRELLEEARIVIRRARDGAEQAAIRYGKGGEFVGVAFLPARQGLVFAAGYGPDSIRLHHASLDVERTDRVADTGHLAFFRH